MLLLVHLHLLSLLCHIFDRRRIRVMRREDDMTSDTHRPSPPFSLAQDTPGTTTKMGNDNSTENPPGLRPPLPISSDLFVSYVSQEDSPSISHPSKYPWISNSSEEGFIANPTCLNRSLITPGSQLDDRIASCLDRIQDPHQPQRSLPYKQRLASYRHHQREGQTKADPRIRGAGLY